STGNGIFDANSTTVPFNDYGDSLLRLRPLAGNTLNGVNLSLVDWFTPFDQLNLGKEGVVYLIDRDNMGFFNSTDNSQIVQSFYGPPYGAWGTPALWQNNLYIGGQDDPIRQFAFDPSTGLFNTTPVSQSTQVFHAECNWGDRMLGGAPAPSLYRAGHSTRLQGHRSGNGVLEQRAGSGQS